MDTLPPADAAIGDTDALVVKLGVAALVGASKATPSASVETIVMNSLRAIDAMLPF